MCLLIAGQALRTAQVLEPSAKSAFAEGCPEILSSSCELIGSLTAQHELASMLDHVARFLKSAWPPTDIYDAAYVYGNEALGYLRESVSSLPRRGVFVRCMSFCFALSRALRMSFRIGIDCPDEIADRAVFFYSSTNQRRSLAPIAERLADSVRLAVCKDDRTMRDEPRQIPLLLPYLLSLLYLPWIVSEYFRASGYRRMSFEFALDDYLLSCGYRLYLLEVLRRKRPAAVIMANDHSMLNRVLCEVCRCLAIPTAYVQHASVTSKFPPLAFDYAFLDGRDALEKYTSGKSTHAIILLAGMPTLDSALQEVKSAGTAKNVIALCAHTGENIDDVVRVAEGIQLQGWRDVSVVIRPHPGDLRRMDQWRRRAAECRAGFSDPAVEDAGTLLIRSQAVVASDSNILLEAAMLRAKPICYPYSNPVVDWYGFIRHGVASYAGTLAELLPQLGDPSDWSRHWLSARRYSEVIDTEFEGRSAELIASTLSDLTHKRSLPGVWVACGTQVYRPTQ
ncbi:MAG: hypothetical protein NFW16_10690 [Candidatus Accumulibacter sp.]|uniref:hypothetical protein n=1 Tax=Accumulibacter sp. TaxID=2053492 RepID=UPI00259113B9|nr:hypothetical protein [Accumulibacter sp.]MCM8622175.1 hypothetical protein [Accumulibacter sp.]